MAVKSRLNEKMREGVAAVLPIALIVMVLCFTVTPIPTDLMPAFVIGTVMLPFAMGACEAVGGNILTDAFGLVSLVAMMPLITIQIMGAIYVYKTRRTAEVHVASFGDEEIIELWEVA